MASRGSKARKVLRATPGATGAMELMAHLEQKVIAASVARAATPVGRKASVDCKGNVVNKDRRVSVAYQEHPARWVRRDSREQPASAVRQDRRGSPACV